MNPGDKLNTKAGRGLFLAAMVLATFCMVPDLMVTPAANTLYETYNESDVNLFLTIPSLISMFVSFAMVPLILKFNKKLLLIIAIVIYLVAGVFGAAIDSMPYMIFMRALMGFTLAMSLSSAMAIVADVFQDEKSRSRYIGYVTAGMSVAGVISTAVCGWIAENFGWKSMMNFSWIGVLILIMVVAFVPSCPPIKGQNAEEMAAEALGENIIVNKNNEKRWKSNLFALLLSYFIFDAFYGVIQFQISIYVAENGIGAETVAGMAASMNSIGAFVGCMVFSFIYTKLKRFSAAVHYLFLPIGFLILFLTHSIQTTFAATLITGFAYGSAMSYFPTRASFIVPAPFRSSAISLVSAAMSVGLFISTYLSSLIAVIFKAESFSEKLPVAVVVLLIGFILSIVLSLRDKKDTSMYYIEAN